MKKPILVVLAAGMGSRYGGIKQMEPMGMSGEKILDFSVFDALEAGFEHIVFILNHAIQEDFKKLVGKAIEQHAKVSYVIQDLHDLPAGIAVPEGRTKPWGTSHAVYSAREYLDVPFAVINADDFYGKDAFHKMYHFLTETAEVEEEYAMIGYLLKNTVTDQGSVSRGVCETEDGTLRRITERLKIEKTDRGIYDNTAESVLLDGDAVVSMNFFGFKPNFVKEIARRMSEYLQTELQTNPIKCEYYLPLAVDALIQEKKVNVKVIPTVEKWYGVTYAEDRKVVAEALKKMVEDGKYPKILWGKKDEPKTGDMC